MDPFHHSQNEHNFHKPKESRIHSNTFLMVVTVICCSLATLALASTLIWAEDAQETADASVSLSSVNVEETGEDSSMEESQTFAMADYDDSSQDLQEAIPEDPSAAAVTMVEEEEEVPQDDGIITEDEAQASLEALRDVFPEGWYWNHVGVEDWDEFTVTQSPCEHDIYWDTYCNTYVGATQTLFSQYYPLEQCLGFASLLSDLVFGEDAPLTVFYDYSQLRPGDHIRLELTEHSMTVLTVEEDGITVVECNSDYQHCRISWDRFLSWDDLAGYSYEMECITRYED